MCRLAISLGTGLGGDSSRAVGAPALGLCSIPLFGQGSATTQKGAAPPAWSDWSALIADLEKRFARCSPKPRQCLPSRWLSWQVQKLCGKEHLASRISLSKTPVDRDTIFEAGSVSKTVFAYRVIKLCERGVLDLDRPLTKYTPDRILKEDPRLDLITTRHVLSHTTGLQNWRSTKELRRSISTPGER